MQLLKERILKDGTVKPGNVLKVDSFLNPRMDIGLINEIGKEFRRRFPSDKITKILTIEASGIGIACIAAQYFHVPVVFAKKAQSINIDGEVYHTKVESFTHKKVYDVILSRKFLDADDHVLVIDDFLANGCALMGLLDNRRSRRNPRGRRHRYRKRVPAGRADHPSERHPSGVPCYHRYDDRYVAHLPVAANIILS